MIRKKNVLELCDVLAQKKAVIFDMDGLLFDTERLFMEQLALVMQEQGYTLSREKYCATLGLGGEETGKLMRSFYGEAYPFAEISREAGRRAGVIAETVGLCVKPHIRELLVFLREKGVMCAVASSTQSGTVKRYLEMTGLSEFFQEVLGGEEVERSKPEPDIFWKACRKLSVEPETAAVLEDSENGVRAAAAAGCMVVCIPDLKQPSGELQPLIDYLLCEECQPFTALYSAGDESCLPKQCKESE